MFWWFKPIAFHPILHIQRFFSGHKPGLLCSHFVRTQKGMSFNAPTPTPRILYRKRGIFKGKTIFSSVTTF